MNDKAMKNVIWSVFHVLADIVLVFLVIQAFMLSYNFFYKVFTDTSVNASDYNEEQFVIPPDSSTIEIIDLLVDDGYVEDKYVMLAKVYLSKYHGKMLPGTYVLRKSMTQSEILKTITGREITEKE